MGKKPTKPSAKGPRQPNRHEAKNPAPPKPIDFDSFGDDAESEDLPVARVSADQLDLECSQVLRGAL